MAWVRARQAQWTDPLRAIRLAEAALRTPRAGAHTRALCAVRAAHAHARIADTDTTSRLLAEAHELAAHESVSPPLPADTPLSRNLSLDQVPQEGATAHRTARPARHGTVPGLAARAGPGGFRGRRALSSAAHLPA
jgi:hypothetical protein